MGTGDGRHEVGHRESTLVGSGVAGRNDQVDAVGAVAQLVLDPGQVGLQLGVAVGHRAQHAQTPGLGDGDHHVTAVGEGHDGELDIEHLGDRGLHGIS